MLGTSLLLLGACSEETKAQADRWAMPANSPGTEQAVYIADLWHWAWVAALITGVIVWALIFYACFAFHRRSDDEIPVQTRYNLPLEIFYTIAPVIMVIVFFAHTVETQNYVLDDDRPDDVCMEIVGQQWSWTFNYGVGEKGDCEVTPNSTEFPYSSYVHDSGTGSQIPQLYLPVGVTTRFNLHSPDVIHDFGIPGFLMKMDVIPGRVNHYSITPTRTGDFRGKCYELCGVYHSRMLFDVHVVTQEEYDAHLQELEDAGATSELPLLGGDFASTPAGLESGDESEEGAE
jgi:cytochrome c oxidase subunit 2